MDDHLSISLYSQHCWEDLPTFLSPPGSWARHERSVSPRGMRLIIGCTHSTINNTLLSKGAHHPPKSQNPRPALKKKSKSRVEIFLGLVQSMYPHSSDPQPNPGLVALFNRQIHPFPCFHRQQPINYRQNEYVEIGSPVNRGRQAAFETTKSKLLTFCVSPV